MLSYQHIYHAGNPADVHKHALLAEMLAYMTRKDKPLSYVETHSGRGLYDLGSAEALKTGEAAGGIARLRDALDPSGPYMQALQTIATRHGPMAYPGSPLLARTLLRKGDSLHLAELHPQEYAALRAALGPLGAQTYKQDGLELALSLCPPTPRRGVLLVDPSYEIKDEYARVPAFLAQVHRKWNVGVLALWYPILTSGAHSGMLNALRRAHPQALVHEVAFPPVREGHRMIGSGMFVINPPYGLQEAATRLSQAFSVLSE